MENYIGYLVAEHREEREKFLPQAFVLTRAIERSIEDKDICFVCGRKGAGKTAVAEMLPSYKANDQTVFDASIPIVEENFKELHTTFFDDIAFFTDYKEGFGSQLETCYYHLWRYILDLATFQAALNLPNISEDFPAEATILGRYMKEDDKIDQCPTDVATVKAMDILSDAKESATPLTKLTLSCKQLRSTGIHKSASEAAMKIFTTHRAVLTIDTMESYDLTDYRIYPMRGLCRAVKEFQTGQAYRGISVKCFLPAEMTDDLFKENLAKYNEFAEYLLWSYSDLLEFMARRFVLLLRDKDKGTEADQLLNRINSERPLNLSRNDFWRKNFWQQFFPETTPNHFGWPEDSCAYLLRHTQKRPREVISCMNSVIQQAIDRKEFPKISTTSLHEGIHDENNMYQLLSDNLAVFNLPRHQKLLSDMAAQLLIGECTVFSGAHFSQFSRRALSILSTENHIDRAEYAQNLMLRSGLVGRVRPHSKEEPAHIWESADGQKCKYYVSEFEYLIPGHVVINENSICAVHPILSDRLGLKPPSGDTGIVYPLPETDDLVRELSRKAS